MLTAYSSLLALALYFGAHGFRCLRLYVLSLGERKGGARLVATHCLTAWVSAAIPFKLGEILRFVGFGFAIKSAFGGAGIWFIERFSDAIAIILIIGGLSFLMPITNGALITLGVAAAFIFGCGFIAWVLIESVPFLRNDLVLRSRSAKGFLALRVVNKIEASMKKIQQLLVGRFSLTLIISLLIWTLDIGAMALWAIALQADVDIARAFLPEGQHEAFMQRLPVFIALTAIGLIILAGIVVQTRRQQHA